MVITAANKRELKLHSDITPQKVAKQTSQMLRLILPHGNKYNLIDTKGKVTEAGKYWFNEVKKEAPPSSSYFDIDTEIVRRHASDYMTLRDGSEAKVRVHDGALGDFKYTDIGRKFSHSVQSLSLYQYLH